MILSTGGSASVHAGIPPPGSQHPPPPRSKHTPQDQAPPNGSRPPPRHRACWEIRSTRGRYASYWNAILFILFSNNPPGYIHHSIIGEGGRASRQKYSELLFVHMCNQLTSKPGPLLFSNAPSHYTPTYCFTFS